MQATNENNVYTCAEYDDFRRIRSHTDRCDSGAPLQTTTQYLLTDGYAGEDLPGRDGDHRADVGDDLVLL